MNCPKCGSEQIEVTGSGVAWACGNDSPNGGNILSYRSNYCKEREAHGETRNRLQELAQAHTVALFRIVDLEKAIKAEIDWLESRRNSREMTTLGMVQEGLRAMLAKPAGKPSPADSP